MAASISSVTTRGFSLSGGFAGSAALIVTLGYGVGAAVEVAYVAPQACLSRLHAHSKHLTRSNVQTRGIARMHVETKELDSNG